MFGKKAIYEVIRRKSAPDTDDILAAIIDRVKTFQQGAETEDDVTLVVAKLV